MSWFSVVSSVRGLSLPSFIPWGYCVECGHSRTNSKNRHDVCRCRGKGVLITSLLFQKQKQKDQGSGKLIGSLQFWVICPPKSALDPVPSRYETRQCTQLRVANCTIVTSQMNYHVIWIGWQQECKHVSRIRLFSDVPRKNFRGCGFSCSANCCCKTSLFLLRVSCD